jgi:ABC-2 type transport system permease protein
MQRIAHITPHAWALDGFAELVRRGGGVVDILPELGVLAAYAVVLFALASWRLRVAITRP